MWAYPPLLLAMSSQRTTHLLLLGMAALWGASWPWARMVAQNMPPLAAASLRFAIASVALLLWLRHTGKLQYLRQLTLVQWYRLTAAASVGVVGYSLFFMWALQRVPASQATLVITVTPVLTLLLAAKLFKEPLNVTIGLGMVLATSGALYAITAKMEQVNTDTIGLLLLIGCALCWTGYTLMGRVVMRGIDALTTTVTTSLIGSLGLALCSLVLEDPGIYNSFASSPLPAWVSLFCLSLGATALANAWYMRGIHELGASTAAAYLILVPLFGIALSAWWLGEQLGTRLLIGALLALSGMAVMHWGRVRQSR